MPDRPRPERGLLDTSVVIDLDRIPAASLPVESSISAVTLAELSAGPSATDDPGTRSRRQEQLQRTEAALSPVAFDAAAARAYGRVYAAMAGQGRKPTGARVMDLLIASVALAQGLPLYTRNPADFAGLDDLVTIHAV